MMPDWPIHLYLTGQGGQGITFLARLLAMAALMDGHQAFYLPQYQKAIRGGQTQVAVTLSKTEISYGIPASFDVVLDFHFVPWPLKILLAPQAIVLSARDWQAHTHVWKGDFSQGLNMWLLGALIQRFPLCSEYALSTALRQLLGKNKAHLLNQNLMWLETGRKWEAAQQHG